MKPLGKPNARHPHVLFDERGRDTGRCLKGSSYRALARLYNLHRNLRVIPSACKPRFVAWPLALLMLCAISSAFSKSQYESQIASFIGGALTTLITGEFAGRRPSVADAVATRPFCRPDDYDELRAGRHDPAAFKAFHERCRLVEIEQDETHVHGTAYLPAGYCVTLKGAFDKVMAEEVYAKPVRTYGRDMVIEHKGSRFSASYRALAEGARLTSACRVDGSLRISAPRQRR